MFCAKTEELLGYSFILLITVIIIVEKNIRIAFKKSLSALLTKCGALGGGGGRRVRWTNWKSARRANQYDHTNTTTPTANDAVILTESQSSPQPT